MHFCLFSSGDVRVNWSVVTKSGATLKAGDVVSVSGLGRLKVKKHHQLFPFCSKWLISIEFSQASQTNYGVTVGT
jgi:ribosomal protein S4